MAALTAADEAIVQRCARHASRYLSPGLTRDDLRQEGRLALLVAQRDGKVPDDSLHRERYTARRVLGAMLDANRSAWRQQPASVSAIDDDDDARAQIAAVDAQPDVICQMRQAVKRILSRGTPQLIACLDLLSSGLLGEEVAERMGVSPSRVSTLKAEARALSARCW